MKKKNIKVRDVIIMIILIVALIAIIIFTATREASNQEIILMEIYKSAGPDTSTASMTHYYIYENTNVIKIRNSAYDGSNDIISKEINQNLIDNFKNALDEYISKSLSINTSFHTNERYTIEYNGATVLVPNPAVATALGFDSNEYIFYNTVENFINTIKN